MLGQFIHVFPPFIGEETPLGLKGGVVDTPLGLRGGSGLIGPMSKAEELQDEKEDRGEGTPEPVEGYKGRSSSGLWAKKQTLLEQFVSSLQRRVRY